MTSIVVVILYFVVCLGIGFYMQSRVVDSTGYFLAGRGLGSWVAGLGRFATVASAFTFLGMLGLGYKLGLPFMISIAVGLTFGFLFCQLLLSEIRRSNAVSIADFFKKRYESTPILMVASIIAILVMFPHIIAQIKGAGVIGSMVLGMPTSVSMVLLTAVFVGYVVLGGLYAISWTDVLQGLLLLVFMVIPAVAIVSSFGGIGATFDAASQISPKFFKGPLPLISNISIMIIFIGALSTFPAFVFWSMTTRDTTTLRRSFVVALVGSLIVYLALSLVLAGGYVWATDIKNPDGLYFAVLKHLFGSGIIAGLGAAAALAAIMSSTDGMLIATSAIICNDISKKLKKDLTEKQLLKIGRIISIVVAGLALICAFWSSSLIGQLTSLAAGSAASAFFFPMVLGVWWKRMNGKGAMIGMVGGYAIYMILSLTVKMPPFTPILVGMPASAILCIVGSLVTAPSPSQADMVDKLHTPNLLATGSGSVEGS